MTLIGLLSWALAGMFGGAIGAFVGAVLPLKDLRWIAMIAAGAVGASLGAVTVQPDIESFLDRQFAAPERRESFDGIYEREIRPEIVKNAALARIFADFPQQEGAFKAALRNSYEQGGEEQLVRDSLAAGAMLSPAVNFYIPRATDADLVRFAAIMADILGSLEAKDPEACILMQFGAAYGRPLADERFRASVDQAILDRQASVINDLIVSAAAAPVIFDALQASVLMDDFRQSHGANLDAPTAEVAGGQRLSANEQEARAACHFTVAMFRDIAAMPESDGALIMRSIAASAPTPAAAPH